jgi:FkbM family methyltransferase
VSAGSTVDRALTAGLRRLPDWRGKASVALAWKRTRERRGPLDGDWRLRLWDGSVVRLPRGSLMTWAVATTGHWDRHVIELLAPYVEPGTLALDVGASLGLWSLPLARAARAGGARLWCFEPNPENLPWLEANLAANGLAGVTEVHAVALGSRPGTARLGYREHGGGNGALLDLAGVATVEVAVRRLDDVELPGRVSFVKMDVEGFELEVLRGARALIARDRPAIFGEFSPDWLAMRGEDPAAELDWIAGLGYDVLEVEERRSAAWRPKDVARLRERERPGAGNLLLVPRDPPA